MTYPHSGNATAGTVPALTQVLSNVVDALRGYQTILERAEDDLKSVVQRLYAVHESHTACVLEPITGQRGTTLQRRFYGAWCSFCRRRSSRLVWHAQRERTENHCRR